MNLLLITYRIPYPLTEGGKISQFALVDYLRNKCSITLLILAYTQADYSAISNLKELWPNVSFEVINGSKPLEHIVNSSRQNIFHFICNNFKHVKFRFNKLFSSRNKLFKSEVNFVNDKIDYLVSFTSVRDQHVIDQVSVAVSRINPDLVQYDFIEILDLALCVPDNIPKVFVHHEIRYLRLCSEIKAAGVKMETYGKYLMQFCEMAEMNLLKMVDGIVTFTEEDKELLQQKLPGQNVYSSPFPVLNKDIVEITDENLLVNKLVFVGLENHSPNKDAVEWYINSMAEIVYQKYNLVLHVVGKWSEEFKKKYSKDPAIHFSDYVEDLGTYCRNSIMLVPVRIGGGIRTKILYAMASGVPVISTKVACEGIIDNDKICITANTAIEFVAAIGKLYHDNNYLKRLVLYAQSVIKSHYTQQVAGDVRLQFYSFIISKHELRNLPLTQGLKDFSK